MKAVVLVTSLAEFVNIDGDLPGGSVVPEPRMEDALQPSKPPQGLS